MQAGHPANKVSISSCPSHREKLLRVFYLVLFFACVYAVIVNDSPLLLSNNFANLAAFLFSCHLSMVIYFLELVIVENLIEVERWLVVA